MIIKVYLGKIADEPGDREDAQKIDMPQTLRTGKVTSHFSDLHHDNLWEPKLIVSVRFFSTLPRMIENITYGQL